MRSRRYQANRTFTNSYGSILRVFRQSATNAFSSNILLCNQISILQCTHTIMSIDQLHLLRGQIKSICFHSRISMAWGKQSYAR